MAHLADYVREVMADASGQWRAELECVLARQPSEPISFLELEKIVDAVERRTGRLDIGFEVGRRLRLDSHGALGAALSRCSTVHQALRLLSGYFDLITPSFVMRYERGPTIGRVVYRPMAVLTPKLLRVVHEMHVVAFHTQFSALMGERLRAYDLHLFMEPPRHATRYALLAPARVHFGGMPLPEAHIEIPAEQLDMPLGGANGQPGRVLAAVGRAVSGSASTDRWSDWVNMILQEAEETRPTLELLAGLLNVTPRTLHRHLAREGCTYRDLAKKVRHQRACRWLEDPARPVTEIALRLGYADVANFSRAFRDASGMAPRSWRKCPRRDDSI